MKSSLEDIQKLQVTFDKSGNYGLSIEGIRVRQRDYSRVHKHK